MRRHLTTSEAARLFEVAPRTIAKACDQGQLPHYRLPCGDRRIDPDGFLAFARKHGKALTAADLPVTAAPRLLVVSGVDAGWLVAAVGPATLVVPATTVVEAGAVLATHEFSAMAIDAAFGRIDAANIVAYAKTKKVRRTHRVASIQDRDGPPLIDGAHAVLVPTLDRAEVARRVRELIA